MPLERFLMPLTLATLLGLSSSLIAATAPDEAALATANATAADQHLLPAYQGLAAATADLDAAMLAQCRSDPAARPAQLKSAFADAFLAWQGVQHLRFGPIQVLSRDFRFQLWPDKRGSVRKHLARLLASKDPARLGPEAFASGSAAVQGFGALERLVYPSAGNGSADDAAWTCRVAAAMTANLAGMASATLAEWRDGDTAHRTMFATAADGNDYYEDAAELSGKLLNALHTQLERMVTQKLDRPLGDGADKVYPKRAEAWRSALSLPALRANTVALQALYHTAFAGPLDGRAPDAAMTAGFEQALRQIDAIERPLAEAVTDPAIREQLVALRATLSDLQRHTATALANKLGLSLGFNSLDGD